MAFAYPGATGTHEQDDTLAPILAVMQGADPITTPSEALALLRFFGLQ